MWPAKHGLVCVDVAQSPSAEVCGMDAFSFSKLPNFFVVMNNQ